MKKITIAVIGAHGAGKTTLCEAASKLFGCTFHREIGEQLRIAALARDGAAHAARPQSDFDREVMRRELARDSRWQNSTETLRMVETWHPGNIAYARERNPKVITPEILRQIGLELPGAVVLPLRMGKAAAIDRLREKQADVEDEEMTSFFLRVARRAEQESRRLGLPVLPPVDTDNLSVKEAVADAVSKIERVLV